MRLPGRMPNAIETLSAVMALSNASFRVPAPRPSRRVLLRANES
jgi:hypothetical protein